MDVISLNHIDFETIKQDLDEFLRKSSTFEDIKETIPASTIDLIERITASYAVYLASKLRRTRQEFYLSTAEIDTSIYNFAYMFGYNINRYTAPQLSIKYLGRETISLKYGDVIGSYEDYQIIYTGEQKKYEQGDILTSVSIGLVNKLYKPAQDFSKIEKIEVRPQLLKAVNNYIALFVDDIQQQAFISKTPEDYLLNKQAIEFSDSIYSTVIYLFDKDSEFGLFDRDINNGIEIVWVETDGYMESLDKGAINLSDQYLFVDIAHLGSFGDSLQKIKNITPYYYHTLRRAVTVKDYTFITLAHPYFKDVFFEREDGVKGVKRIKISDTSNLVFQITIYGTNYEIDASDTTTTKEAYQKIYDAIKNNTLIKATLNDDYVEIENQNTRLDFDKNIGTSSNLFVEDIVKNEKPICCTMLCYYIKYNTTNDPVIFTKEEQQQISDYLSEYQMIGTNVIFIPAQKLSKPLSLEIKVKSSDDVKQVEEQVDEIIKEYELSLRKNFYYGELLAKIGAIEEVTFVRPMQEIYDVKVSGDKYLIFDKDIKVEVE